MYLLRISWFYRFCVSWCFIQLCIAEELTSPSEAGSGGGSLDTTMELTPLELIVPEPTATSKELLHTSDVEALGNETREALSSDGDLEPVEFVADGTGYIPVRAPRPLRPSGNGDSDLRYPLETWDRDYNKHRHNSSRVHHIEAECQDDYMKIRVGFNGSFAGLLYSSGYAYDPDCVYINGTGRDYYEFFIQLNRCGTLGKNTHNEDSRKNPTKNFMWNTVTVQYNPLIEEEWDEHFKVTCEYGYDFWKTVTFPFLDVEVATGNPVVFTLSPPECYMEIRHGYGTNGNRVGGPVRVGDPLTLLIYMRSKYDGFDIVVNDCYAHNGATKKIQLIDQYGCPVDDKLISRFRGSWSETGVFETQVFAYMKTFRFTGSPALYIECDVRMCHGRCPSQPCHWRNAKNIQKRSIGNLTLSSTPTPVDRQSENINLFQSLRVLQEGELIDEGNSTAKLQDSANVCLKAGAFTALFGLGGILLSALTLSLVAMCYRMKRINKSKMGPEIDHSPVRFDHKTFMTHKGRIN